MPRRIPLRNSLLARLLTASVLIALLSIASTAWLVVRSTTLAIEREQGQVLADDTRIQDALTGYAARHRNWSGVNRVVRELAEETGRVIILTTRNRKVIAEAGRAQSMLPARASAVIDPLNTAVDRRRDADSEVSSIDPRAVGPYRLPARERRHLERLARDRVACMATNLGIRAQVAVRPSGRPYVRVTGSALSYSGLIASACPDASLEQPTRTEAGALAELGKLVEACAERRGVTFPDDLEPTVEFVVPLRAPPAQVEIVDTCVEESRAEQLARHVAANALLFMETASGSATPVFDLSAANAARVAGVTGLVLALTVSVTTVIAVRLVRPLRALTDAAREPDGQYLRVRVTSRDETGYLVDALNDLSERRARVEELRKAMVSDIAHELRTPLTNIRGWLEAAQDGIAVPDTALFTSLQDQALLLQHIVDDLQVLAAADAGTLRLHPERLRVRDLVEQVAAAHRAGSEAAEVTVLTHIVGEPVLDADPVRLRQVLGNLMSNAVRHTPAGGKVTLTAHRAGDEVEIQVVDTGSGIEPADLPKVFDRFWRAEKSRTRQSGGSGLGLSIVTQLVEAHRGKVSVTSVPGTETVFTLRLPADA